MSTFQPSIPTGTVKLSEDYTNIQQNFNQLDVTFGVDHVTFSNQTAQNGYHKDLHLVPVSTVASNPPNNNPIVAPVTVAGIGQLFAAQNNDGFNVDESLFFLTGGGRQMRLTRNFDPVTTGAKGATYLPGGVIIQWGTITNATSQTSTTVKFTSGATPVGTVDFKNNIYGVFANLQKVDSDSDDVVFVWNFTLDGFTYRNTASSAHKIFNWIAIGN
jgi:hypothetical protein